MTAMGLTRIKADINAMELGCLQEYLTKTRSQVGVLKEYRYPTLFDRGSSVVVQSHFDLLRCFVDS